MSEQPAPAVDPRTDANTEQTPVAQQVETPGSPIEPARLDFILDVPLEVTVELGRRRMSIGELLRLGPGAVIELSKAAGEPLDVLINGKLVARGEAVVANDRFGVRLTDVVSPAERIEHLGR